MILNKVILTIMMVSLCFGVHANEPSSNEQSRLLFLAAERALDNGDLDTYTFIKKELKDYPLIPYLEYQKSKIAIRQMSSSKGQGYDLQSLTKARKQLEGLPLWDFLLYRWLKAEAKQKRWGNFVNGYALRGKPFISTELKCYTHYAHFMHTQSKQHLIDALPLWLVGKSQPKSCDKLFSAMRKHKVIESSHIAQRLYLSIEHKQYALANYLAKISPNSTKAFKTWIKVAQSPALLKDKNTRKFLNQSQYKQKIYQSLFYRYSRYDVIASRDLFAKIGPYLNKSTQAYITQDIAIRLAHKKDSTALKWLNKIPKAYLNPVASEWLIRLNLRDKNWANVIKTIDNLDPLISSKTSWQYWKARAHLALNQSHIGLKILNELAHLRNYYGFLASEHLKQPHPLKHAPLKLDGTTVHHLAKQPAFKRINELKALRRILSAKREWLYFIKHLPRQDKPAAARLAYDRGWYDLAIITLAQSDELNDLTIRFPLGYKDTIEKHAKQNNLDEAWIFALTRQESAFSSKVRSPVGATGLMQLMPATARYVAKKNKFPKPSVYQLMNPSVNIKIGAKYLGALNQSFKGQMVLATASYNAGVNRIITWLPEESIDSDIWIENVPFRETRHYVKNILTYMGIYKSMMGQPFRLSSVMKPIPKFEEDIKTP